MPEKFKCYKQQVGYKKYGKEQQRAPDKLVSVILPDKFIEFTYQYVIIVRDAVHITSKNEI